MKRLRMVLTAVLLTVCLTVTTTAQASFVYVTDFAYLQITDGGRENTMLYTAMDSTDGFVMGILTAEGEQSREVYSADGWDAMIAPREWETTVHGTAASLCPYASTHGDSTVCPYLEVSLVTLTNTVTGVALENYYIPKTAVSLLPDGAVHFCWGRYGYSSPVSLKWDGENDLFALKNSDGKWGVFDAAANAMLTDYAYSDMSAVYRSYAKVSDGTTWGRLDVTGTFETEYLYDAEASFSVQEELREIADGQWQVFTKDNEAVSVIFSSSDATLSYASSAHLVTAVYADGTSALLDLNGDVVAAFTQTQTAEWLQDSCYAVEQYDSAGDLSGIALARVDGAVQPKDTVLKGDVNMDGVVDSCDSRMMLRNTVGTYALTDLQKAVSDMDDSGALTAGDVRTHMILTIS